MKKSYYDNKKGAYVDTTTGNLYRPKMRCELCKSPYMLSVHHFLNQQKCLRDLASKKVKFPNMWDEKFIKENQKLFTVCFQCHSDIENLEDKKFFEKYKIKREKFIYRS